MVILLTGATGFIGRHLAQALVARGHEVVCAARRARAPDPAGGCHRFVPADFTRDLQPEAWLPRLAGIDLVVNAVGILREQGAQTFDAVHRAAPCALFAACAAAGVRRVVQISALGADAQAASGYHRSKKAADDCLAALPLDWAIVQPSLVYGAGGTSARLFDTMASLPLVPLTGRGDQQVQPIHVDDAVAALVALIESPSLGRRRIALVGPEPLAMRAFLGGLRESLGAGPARFAPVPMPLVRLGARAGAALPGSLLDAETLAMLERGNTADAADTRALLGHEPRGVWQFVAPIEAPARRVAARLQWLLPVLRWSVAAVWIWTAIVSLGLYPVEDSYGLLARTGITGALAPVALYGAALLDLAFGLGVLLLRRRRWLWIAQIALILGYTVIISFRLPEFWLHPYGPILKNLPMLALLWLLVEIDEPPPAR